MNKAIFLDRDGVINQLIYNEKLKRGVAPRSPREFKIISNVPQAINQLKNLGFLIIVISNQPDIAKGILSSEKLKKITQKMKQELAKNDASLDAIYYCPHHPDPEKVNIKKYLKNCSCRKPKPGLIFKAVKKLKIDLSSSFMIGDTLFDIQTAKNAGCRSIFLTGSKCSLAQNETITIKPNFTASDLFASVKIIKNHPY